MVCIEEKGSVVSTGTPYKMKEMSYATTSCAYDDLLGCSIGDMILIMEEQQLHIYEKVLEISNTLMEGSVLAPDEIKSESYFGRLKFMLKRNKVIIQELHDILDLL